LAFHNSIIITGAANGIGKAIVNKLYNEGAAIFACDIDNVGLYKLKKEFPGVKIFHIDITDYKAVCDFFDEIKDFQCNCLVNNAGIYLGKSILDYQLEEIQKVTSVNSLGAIYFTKEFAKNLIVNSVKGAIVNIASVSGQEGSSDAIYGMTKAAIIGLTKSTAINFATHIRVNAIAPALVETTMIKNVPKERFKELREKELLQIAITPADIAESVWFLLSAKSKNITGITLDINNGQYMR
jgi:3-oxoacyl-[acyl-carrier protein] reductase